MSNPNYLLSSYDYDLPEALIAQTPAERRESSRLMVYHRHNQERQDASFADLGQFLQPGDLLVLNNTRVFPARIFGEKAHTGTRFEFLLTHQEDSLYWRCIAKNSKRIKAGYTFRFPEGVEVEVLNISTGGQLEIVFKGLPEDTFWDWLERHGEIPYPPYITSRASKRSRYQTVFGEKTGSVAAPTAGLHFSPELMSSLQQQGIQFAYLTLHVGIGTFSPVRTENILDHDLHAEYYQLSTETADLLNKQRAAGQRIISVGTTATRTLETVYREHHGHFSASEGETRLFVYPGQTIGAIDGLITNFHLPRSSLLMLVSAWIGREELMALYQEAIKRAYRFYSFGDAMLLL